MTITGGVAVARVLKQVGVRNIWFCAASTWASVSGSASVGLQDGSMPTPGARLMLRPF